MIALVCTILNTNNTIGITILKQIVLTNCQKKEFNLINSSQKLEIYKHQLKSNKANEKSWTLQDVSCLRLRLNCITLYCVLTADFVEKY